MGVVQSDYPPVPAIEKFLGASARHIRRIEIYEQDGVTRWAKDTVTRLKSGAVNVDYSRDERRTLDLTLDNSDGVLLNAPGEFWYDKIIKVWRGVVVDEPARVPRVGVISDKAGGSAMASAFRSVLVNANFGDVQVNVLADTAAEIEDYDILVALSNATGPQVTVLTNAYRAGKSVMVFDTDAAAFVAPTYTGEVGTSSAPDLVTPVPNLSHPVAQGWAPFTLLGPTVVSDSFGRTVSSDWGTTDTGQTYTQNGGTASDYSVGSGYGQMLLPTVAAREENLLSVALQDLDATFDIQCPQTPTGSAIQGFFHARRSDGSNYYLGVVSFTTAGNIDVLISKRIAGTITNLVTQTSAITGFSTSAFYRVRFRVVGSLLRIKIWLSTATEPATWNLETTNTELTGAHPVGFRSSPVTGNTNTNPSLRYDNLRVTNEALVPSGDTTVYDFTAVSSDTVTLIAPVVGAATRARIAATEDPGSGGRAVVFSALIDTAFFGNAEFAKFLASAISWLNRVDPVTQWETQIGEFMVDRISEPHFPHEMKITGRDYTKKCMNSKFSTATQFDAGYSLEALISSLASNAGVRKKQLPVTGITVGKSFYYDRGVTRWEAMKQIANAYNYALYFSADGYLVMSEFVDPSKSAPVLYIETGKEGQIASYEKTTTDARIYNHVVVTGESSDSTVPNVYAIAQNTDPTSPTNVDELGERVYTYTSSFIVTTQQCQDVADSLLAIHSLEEFELSFETLMLPWLDVGQILGFIDPSPAPGDPTDFLLTGLTFPLSLGPMAGSARRLTIVG